MPREDPKMNAACSFLLEVLLNLEEKWKAKVMERFLTHDNTFACLLTEEQQQILFDKLKIMTEQSRASNITHDQVSKWLVKLVIGCEKITEYKELVVSTITDPANINLLNEAAYSNLELLKLVLEEHERDPRDTTELLLLRFASFAKEFGDEGLITQKFNSVLISIIRKRIAQYHAEDNSHEHLEQEHLEQDSTNMSDNESMYNDMNQDDMAEDNNMNQDDDVMVDESDDKTDSDDDQNEFLSIRELLDLLTRLVSKVNDDMAKQILPEILSIIKTENDSELLFDVYVEMAYRFLKDSSTKSVEVADQIAASVQGWLLRMDLPAENILEYSFILKGLLNNTSKNFLTTDVVAKLVDPLVTEVATKEVFLENPEAAAKLWMLLITHAEDPDGPTNALYQMLESMLTSNYDSVLYLAITQILALIKKGAFSNPKLAPLLDLAWKVKYRYKCEGIHQVSADDRFNFIGAVAIHCPSFIVDNLTDILNFIEEAYSMSVSAEVVTPNYILVINHLEDSSTWIHHMKILLSNFDLDSVSLWDWQSSEAYPIFIKLTSPLHPHYKKLLEDPQLVARLEEILLNFEKKRDEDVQTLDI